MDNPTFDEWLTELDLSFWGTAQHKLTPAQFFELKNALLLDVRSPEEASRLALPFALHIPINELPRRWQEVPGDRVVATFCSSSNRAVVAWVYLQLHGLDNVRVLEAGYGELAAELGPGKTLLSLLRK